MRTPFSDASMRSTAVDASQGTAAFLRPGLELQSSLGPQSARRLR